MTLTGKIVGATALTVTVACTAGACGDTSGPELLPEDSVPGVQEQFDGDSIPAVGWCRELNMTQARTSYGSRPAAKGVEYRLENGDYVHAIVIGPAPGKSVDDLRSDLQDAMAKCAAERREGMTVEPLSGLTDRQWGYTSTERGATGRQIFEETPAGNLLAVGVRHEGKGEPGIDVEQLTRAASKKADAFVSAEAHDQG